MELYANPDFLSIGAAIQSDTYFLIIFPVVKSKEFKVSEKGIKMLVYADYLQNGIYLTTAIKCVKKDYLVAAKTIENCSHMLEKEIDLFKNVHVVLLMGDFVIKAINSI
ncbi:MAG: hypothetical protein M0P01_06800 [Treponema sp.]|nr:hypothetical protein [Treponema sp.]